MGEIYMDIKINEDFDASNGLESLLQIRQEVQRKLGCNVMLLQHYELLVKGLLTEGSFSGFVDELSDLKRQKAQTNWKKTLGQVSNEFLGNCIIDARDVVNDTLTVSETIDQVWLSVNRSFILEGSHLEEFKNEMAEIVELRNKLIHHFVESYNIHTEEGCALANTYLDTCYELIDAHYQKLRNFAKKHIEINEIFRNFIGSTEFEDFVLHGILPKGGGVLWPASTIVDQLKKAETSLTQRGWTCLQDAIEYMRLHAPEHIPKRYGCSSWRHVLHESGQFDIRKENLNKNTKNVTWYKSRDFKEKNKGQNFKEMGLEINFDMKA